MTDVVVSKRRVDPGKVGRLREWMAEVREREDEAVETLQNEGVYTESTFLGRDEEGPYLLYYVEAEDFEAAMEAYRESDHDIDREHRAVMDEVLADDHPDEGIEPLYHLVNPDRPGGG